MSTIIDGKAVAADIKKEIAVEVNALADRYGKKPGLAVVLVGSDPASQVYVGNKEKGCAEVGFNSFKYTLPENTSEAELLKLVEELNNRDDVDGVLVQLPLPGGIDEKKVINAIAPDKDVDGFHPINVGKMVIGDDTGFAPCTPIGCQELIKRYIGKTDGLHVVIVGRSNIVGKPLANLMVQRGEAANCVVTICHTGAKDIAIFTRQADILVAAVGRPGLITADMVKEGAVVIDVGTNRIPHPTEAGKTKLVGDVAFSEVEPKASFITPVPGGVGPMTIVMLLKNTLKAFRLHNGVKD